LFGCVVDVVGAFEPLLPEERRRDPRREGALAGGSARVFIAGRFGAGVWLLEAGCGCSSFCLTAGSSVDVARLKNLAIT